MKKLFIAFSVVVALALGAASRASAESKGKEITLSGKGMCAKCCLKQGDACQNVLQIEKAGKDGKKTKVSYYLADNKLSKDFHGNICKVVKPVKLTGTCVKEGDKLVVTVSKIELAE